MATFEDRIFINAPVDKVFRSVTSPENWPTYVPSLIGVGFISTPDMQPGTTFEWEYRVLGATLRGTGHVNQIVPNAKFSMSMNGSVSVKETYTFTPVSGGTDLSIHIDYSVPAREIESVIHTPAEQKMKTLEGEYILARIKLLCEET